MPANPDSLPTLEQRRQARLAERKDKHDRQLVAARSRRKLRHHMIVFITTLPDKQLKAVYEAAFEKFGKSNSTMKS